jgi:hypothetical protein
MKTLPKDGPSMTVLISGQERHSKAIYHQAAQS